MYNRLLIKDNSNVYLNFPIYSVYIDINSHDSLYSYSNPYLEISMDYKNGGDLLDCYSNNPYSLEMVLSSLEDTKCISIRFFTLRSSFYDNTYILKVEYRKLKNTDISEYPDLKSLYREIKINKILNNV